MLGNTIGEVAWSTSVILKEESPAYTAEQSPDAMLALRRRATKRNICLNVMSQHRDVDTLILGLAGDFLRVNVSLAIVVAAEHLHQMGYLDTPRDIMNATLPIKFCRGLSDASWSSRCEAR